jgi:mannose-6-phosphate isomerase
MSSSNMPSLKGERNDIFAEVERYLDDHGYTVAARDFNRPWGGFFVIDESQAEKFAAQFFPGIDFSTLKIDGGKLSPKVLMVQPKTRLSWQYHFRRSEIWKIAAGSVGVVTSDTDEEGPLQTLQVGEIIRLRKGQRHRLVGLDGWGMVAEIWQHTDPSEPSNEDDIVRVQDDFGR